MLKLSERYFGATPGRIMQAVAEGTDTSTYLGYLRQGYRAAT